MVGAPACDPDYGGQPGSLCVSSAGWFRAPTRMIDSPVTRSSLRGSLSRWTGPHGVGIVVMTHHLCSRGLVRGASYGAHPPVCNPPGCGRPSFGGPGRSYVRRKGGSLYMMSSTGGSGARATYLTSKLIYVGSGSVRVQAPFAPRYCGSVGREDLVRRAVAGPQQRRRQRCSRATHTLSPPAQKVKTACIPP